MSNIQTFNARSVAATPKINNVSAGKNLVNINLTNANLHHQEANKGAFDGKVDLGVNALEVKEYTLEELMAYDEEVNATLSENDLKDKSLDEILKEGQETYAEMIDKRNQEAAQKAIDAINDIGKVDLNSGDEIKAAIDAYNSLTPEQKALVPQEELDKIRKAQEELQRKQQEEAERIRREKLRQLEALYQAREDNNGLFHPKREKEIEAQIAKMEAELGVPHKPDGWESFCNTVEEVGATAVTFCASVVEGFVDVGEGVFDTLVYGAGKVGEVFGIDNEWAEDIIAYDVSGEMYDAFVDATGIDHDIAYGWAHDAGNFVGEMVGYYALSSVPYVGPALSAMGGAGKGIEDSIKTQLAETGEVNEWKVFGSGLLGAAEGYGFGKATQGFSQGIKAVGKTGVKQTLKSSVSSISKETLKTTAKNSGKIALHTAGQTFTDVDTYIDVASVIGDDVVRGFETGEWDWGTITKEAAFSVGGNYTSNLTFGMWRSSTGITPDLAKTAEVNYKKNSGDFTNKSDYYADLAYVESKNYWTTDQNGKSVHIVLDPDDPGITRCLTGDARVKWQSSLDSVTDFSSNTSRVNLTHTNSQVFNDFVVGNGSDYGQFGMPDNYNFARMGEATPDVFVNSASENGTDLITQFKKDSGIPVNAQKNDRIIFCSHDVPRTDISMHTGKELNSYSERLPGGRLPNGDYEVSYNTQKITSNSADATSIVVKDSSGKTIWSGSLATLKDYQKTNPDLYKKIVFG